jgi:hypothetical protein
MLPNRDNASVTGQRKRYRTRARFNGAFARHRFNAIVMEQIFGCVRLGLDRSQITIPMGLHYFDSGGNEI